MGLLWLERSYLAVDVQLLLEDPNSPVLKNLHSVISHGIAIGFVRPLTCVRFPSSEVVRAFRLVAASEHRGRVLVQLNESYPLSVKSLHCSNAGCHVLLCNGDIIGLQFAERLISRGARTLRLVYNKVPAYVHYKKRSWDKIGAQVELTSLNIFSTDSANNIFNEIPDMAKVEGVYVIATDANSSNAHEYNILLDNLDVTSRKLWPNLKYFAMVCSTINVGKQAYDSRTKNHLPATLLYLSKATKNSSKNDSTGYMSCRSAVDAIERALLCKSSALLAESYTKPQLPILESLASVTGINQLRDMNDDVCLENFTIDQTNIAAVSALLADDYDVSLSDEKILKLSVPRLKEIEQSTSEKEYENIKGLNVFYSLVDSDEIMATTEFIILPTMANNNAVNDDEFDVKQKYLYIIPGLEGHHGRFRTMCESFKIPALVLQPGLDKPHETLQELAQRYVKLMVEKTKINDNFYLLGFETGVAVALEVAAILENQGYVGTVFCVGLLPNELKYFIEEQVREYKTEEELQNAVLQHMCGLMTKEKVGVMEQTMKAAHWGEKVDACVRLLLGQVSHSAQYARALIEAAYARLQQARAYDAQWRPLCSQLVLLRATTTAGPTPTIPHHYSLQPVLQYQLTAPLAHALSDLRCASIVNRHLAPAVLEEFQKKNHCETYLVNSDTFMNVNVKID